MRLCLQLSVLALCLALAAAGSWEPSVRPRKAEGIRLRASEDSFPYSCFRIGNYPDTIYFNYSSVDSWGETIYTGQSLLNGQFYAAAYAHVQNGTGYVHILLSYSGRAANRTRAILVQQGGSGGDSISVTYMLDRNQYSVYEPAHEVDLVSCDSAVDLESMSSVGSGDVMHKTVMQSVGSSVQPTAYGQYCVDMEEWSYETIYMNATGSDVDGVTPLIASDIETGALPTSYGGGFLTSDGSLFVVLTYLSGSSARLISAAGVTANGVTDYYGYMTYGIYTGQYDSFYDNPSNYYGLQQCQA